MCPESPSVLRGSLEQAARAKGTVLEGRGVLWRSRQRSSRTPQAILDLPTTLSVNAVVAFEPDLRIEPNMATLSTLAVDDRRAVHEVTPC